jgi:hypothetical protein
MALLVARPDPGAALGPSLPAVSADLESDLVVAKSSEANVLEAGQAPHAAQLFSIPVSLALAKRPGQPYSLAEYADQLMWAVLHRRSCRP